MSEQANLSGENEISSWAEGACAHLVVEDLAALLLSFTVSLSFLVGADFIAVLVEAKENVFPGDVWFGAAADEIETDARECHTQENVRLM